MKRREKLQSQVPKNNLDSYFVKDKVKYVYHDKNNEVHELGYASVHSTQRHLLKNKLSITPNDKIELVFVRDIPSSPSDSVKFRFITWNSESQRWYINPACLAGLLGAMIEESIEDLGFNGFSDINGESTGESTSHINGVKGDLRYLSINNNGEATLLTSSHFDHERQVRFNNALYKFFWGRTEKMYSEKFLHNGIKDNLLPHCQHKHKEPTKGNPGYRHDNHLHLTGFNFNLVTER